MPAPGGEVSALEGVPVPGGACPRGVPALGGCLHWGWVSALGGACWRPPCPMATAAGGTHPTGMHSCSGKEKICFTVLLRIPICFVLIFRHNSCTILFFSPALGLIVW